MTKLLTILTIVLGCTLFAGEMGENSDHCIYDNNRFDLSGSETKREQIDKQKDIAPVAEAPADSAADA